MITMIGTSINNNDVLYKLVEGKSYQIIADELGVSKTTISNAVKKLEKEIGEKNVKTILEIAVAAKKAGISFAQMLSCARVYKILEKRNLDDDQVYAPNTISKLNKYSEQHRNDAITFIGSDIISGKRKKRYLILTGPWHYFS
mgnify:CR=1 FL=1